MSARNWVGVLRRVVSSPRVRVAVGFFDQEPQLAAQAGRLGLRVDQGRLKRCGEGRVAAPESCVAAKEQRKAGGTRFGVSQYVI